MGKGRRTLRLVAQAVEHAPEIICFQEADCYNMGGPQNLKRAFNILGYDTAFHMKLDTNGGSGNRSGIFIAWDKQRYSPLKEGVVSKALKQDKDVGKYFAIGSTFIGEA